MATNDRNRFPRDGTSRTKPSVKREVVIPYIKEGFDEPQSLLLDYKEIGYIAHPDYFSWRGTLVRDLVPFIVGNIHGNFDFQMERRIADLLGLMVRWEDGALVPGVDTPHHIARLLPPTGKTEGERRRIVSWKMAGIAMSMCEALGDCKEMEAFAGVFTRINLDAGLVWPCGVLDAVLKGSPFDGTCIPKEDGDSAHAPLPNIRYGPPDLHRSNIVELIRRSRQCYLLPRKGPCHAGCAFSLNMLCPVAFKKWCFLTPLTPLELLGILTQPARSPLPEAS